MAQLVIVTVKLTGSLHMVGKSDRHSLTLTVFEPTTSDNEVL
jgi:polyisoprenoid-binding protein YceI